MCGRLCISQGVCLPREPHLIAFSGPPSQAVMSQSGRGEENKKKQRGARGNKGGRVRTKEQYRRLQLKGAGEG